MHSPVTGATSTQAELNEVFADPVIRIRRSAEIGPLRLRHFALLTPSCGGRASNTERSE